VTAIGLLVVCLRLGAGTKKGVRFTFKQCNK
jgi:hypothetical protein